jgi:hypothetical protein
MRMNQEEEYKEPSTERKKILAKMVENLINEHFNKIWLDIGKHLLENLKDVAGPDLVFVTISLLGQLVARAIWRLDFELKRVGDEEISIQDYLVYIRHVVLLVLGRLPITEPTVDVEVGGHYDHKQTRNTH